MTVKEHLSHAPLDAEVGWQMNGTHVCASVEIGQIAERPYVLFHAGRIGQHRPLRNLLDTKNPNKDT